MARQRTRDGATSQVDQTIGRIREINDRILESGRRGGEASLQAYERLLKGIADAQEAAGGRGAEWVRAFTAAEAKFTRELADGLPEAVRTTIERATGLADTAARQARRVPGVEPVEGETRGAVAREQDLPIRNYDQLTADQIIQRLARLSQQDLHKVDAYERKHADRKTVHQKIETLTH
jgi:hypothetical protein